LSMQRLLSRSVLLLCLDVVLRIVERLTIRSCYHMVYTQIHTQDGIRLRLGGDFSLCYEYEIGKKGESYDQIIIRLLDAKAGYDSSPA
ncbi:MAG: hypothetical protein MUO26_06860, partial [Methanotrichaceae archaeon]|nr:hypothetical protein [Methanotrichaceae archaeon]